jgi:hypothetical protein
MADEKDEKKASKRDEAKEKQEQMDGTAFDQKAQDNSGRDWTKRRTFLKPGQV